MAWAVRFLGIAPLVMVGDLQAQLHGAGRQDEVAQRRRLRLPAEPADPLVLQPADPPGDLGEARVLDRRGVLDHAIGDGVDQPGTEQGRRIPLGADQHKLADVVLHELLSAHVDGILGLERRSGSGIHPRGMKLPNPIIDCRQLS